MDSMQLSAIEWKVIAGVIGILLATIAFFLSRLLSQFDKLTTQVSTLNETIKKIDKDLSGQVGILQTRVTVAEGELEDLNPLWDRTRKCEERLAVAESMISSVCKTHAYGG